MYCKGFTISKNALGKNLTICMQAFLSRYPTKKGEKKKRKLKWTESPLKQQTAFCYTLKMCSKMSYQLKSQKATYHTHSLPHTTNSHWHGFSWSGSLSCGPLSRVHVANSNVKHSWLLLAAVGPKRQFTEQPRHHGKGVGEELWLC